MTKEHTTIDGLIYVRTKWRDDGDWEPPFWLLESTVKDAAGNCTKQNAGDKPHIVCFCGGTAFSLRYGNYEMLARCEKCGAEGVVYDG